MHKKLKLRATPKQLTNYDTAIELLLMVDETVSDNPLLMKKGAINGKIKFDQQKQ